MKCGICGSELVYIRGRVPGHDNRRVCPTCLAERMDRIQEMAARDYGIAEAPQGEMAIRKAALQDELRKHERRIKAKSITDEDIAEGRAIEKGWL